MISLDDLNRATDEALAELRVHYPCVNIGTICQEIGTRLGMNSTERDMFRAEVEFFFGKKKAC